MWFLALSAHTVGAEKVTFHMACDVSGPDSHSSLYMSDQCKYDEAK